MSLLVFMLWFGFTVFSFEGTDMCDEVVMDL